MHLALEHLDEFSVVESWSGYFHPTDPTGTKPLDLGSAARTARADVHRQIPAARAELRPLPTFIAFYVGRDDWRFSAENEQLNRELSAGGHPARLPRSTPAGTTSGSGSATRRRGSRSRSSHLAPAARRRTTMRHGHDREADDARPARLPRVDALLDDEERAIRDTIRQFVRERILPDVGDWFEQGSCPASSRRSSPQLGLFGMHLEGYGLPGASSVAYGLTCMELEAGDAGVRSLVSVQGSLAMFAIWRWGSEEQKQRWLPAMHAGEAIGCFGLTEPDAGSDPGAMRTTRAPRRLRLDPQRLEDVDHERHDRRHRGRVGAHRRRRDQRLPRRARHARASRRPRCTTSCRCARR